MKIKFLLHWRWMIFYIQGGGMMRSGATLIDGNAADEKSDMSEITRPLTCLQIRLHKLKKPQRIRCACVFSAAHSNLQDKSTQLHHTKGNRLIPFLLAEILNFQGSSPGCDFYFSSQVQHTVSVWKKTWQFRFSLFIVAIPSKRRYNNRKYAKIVLFNFSQLNLWQIIHTSLSTDREKMSRQEGTALVITDRIYSREQRAK